MTYSEAVKRVSDDVNTAFYENGGKGRPLFNYDENDEDSLMEHMDLKPSYWDNDKIGIDWKHVKFGMVELSRRFNYLPKLEKCTKIKKRFCLGPH